MGQFITLAITLGSLAGIVFIVYRKIPLLLELSEKKEGEAFRFQSGQAKQSVLNRIKSRMQEKVLDTTLSKARMLASKTETQTGAWLERLRKKSDQHKDDFQESYWDQFRKKSKDKNNPPA